MGETRPVDPRAERICKMITDLVGKHKDEIDECNLDWTILTLSNENDGYRVKVEVPVPLFNMKFRQYY